MGKMKPLEFERLSHDEMRERAEEFRDRVATRRSVRQFSDEPVPVDAIRAAIHAAGQAPSGANKQPWTFALVTDPEVKREIRLAAEAEEREFYARRAPQDWLDDLRKFATGPEKPYLETAPALVIVFGQSSGPADEKHYYVKESVGLACGFLLAALHHAGFATLTHTPSPMGFLSKVLDRPSNERPYLLIPVGYPAEDAEVPDIERKPLSEILVEYSE